MNIHPASSDEVIRHILQAIVERVKKTKRAKNPVSDTLAAYLVRATVLNPSNHFKVDSVFTKEDVDRLIELCSHKLTQINDPETETVQMQVYFDTSFPQQAGYLHQEKQMRKNTVANVLREITGTPAAKTLPQIEALYRKMVSYVLLKAAMGTPADPVAAREATVALESVFPQSEIATFLALGRADQEKQLNGLTQLVGGIRLFNFYVNKASRDNLDNIPELCAKEIQDAFKIIEERTNDITEKLHDLVHTAMDGERSASHEPMYRVIDAVLFYRQLMIYLDAVKVQIQRSSRVLETLDTKLKMHVQQLQGACKSRMAVPVDQVYPLFMTLHSVWEAFQDELFLNAFRRGLLDRLCLHADSFAVDVPRHGEMAMPGMPAARLPDAQILEHATVLQDAVTRAAQGHVVEVLHPGNTAQYYSLPLEFSGFCPVTLTRPQHPGLVVPGDWNIGILKYKDKLYACSSMQAAKEFATSAEEIITNTVVLAREKMGLVQLLQLYGYFPSIQALENAQSFSRDMLLSKNPLVCESSAQCDVHIVDRYIDPNYEWNEWDMRKKALMLVNLRKKRTHGSQTYLSHFKRENCTQVYLPKVDSAQTKSDKATGMSKKLVILPSLNTSQQQP